MGNMHDISPEMSVEHVYLTKIVSLAYEFKKASL